MVINMKLVPIITALCFFTSGHCYFYDLYISVLDKLGFETCDEKLIKPDFHKLRQDLNNMLFGQEIIINKLVPILESHFTVEPKKALVISMHGWTGSGKNYATKIVVDSLFKNKINSGFVRMFNGRLHFPFDQKEYVDEYKISIQNWIRGNVTNCPRTVFVFDEIDKMPQGIVDAIKPFLDYHEKIDSIDYRKSIFIFISNMGAEVINTQYMNLWRSGKSRPDMEYKDFEPLLRHTLYKSNGAFRHSSIIEGHLVSLYLPFLPLEIEHVEKCIEAEFVRQGIKHVSESKINAVLDEVEFNSDRFSMSGCKRISDIVASLRYNKIYQEL